MDYNKLQKIILEASKNSEYFSNDSFPVKLLNSKEGRFELLALSVLDVWGFDADRLWFDIAVKLRNKNILSIDYLIKTSVDIISKELMDAGYNRGEKTNKKYSKILNKLAKVVNEKYNDDISEMFVKFEDVKNQSKDNLRKLISELDDLPGIGQKIATMFIKMMIGTFSVWNWQNKDAFIGIPIPDDSQVRKVFFRLGNEKSENLKEDYAKFSENLNVSFIELDDVMWNVGRIFCNNSFPNCHYCIFKECCKYSDLRKRRTEENFMEMKEDMKKIDSLWKNS